MDESHGLGALLQRPFNAGFQIGQSALDRLLSPYPPSAKGAPKLNKHKIAVIGAGITGVTSAAHCIGHGFDVTLFESGPREGLGGIWSRVNDVSGLQIHSAMYRFHPSVKWSGGYPKRDEIVGNVRKLWETYELEPRTKFNVKVDKVFQDGDGRWVVNDPSHGKFEGIIAAIGTCGDNKVPHIQGMENFMGKTPHSSQLTGLDVKGKKVAIIGGGASAVEALDFAFQGGAEKTYILSRSDKWIIPRNLFIDTLLSWNILGQETIFSWIPETLIRKLFYRDLESIAPTDKGIFTDTPMVNSDVLKRLRSGKAEWLRCDIEQFVDNGVQVNRRAKGVPKGGPGHQQVVEADIVIMATGFKRPSLSFLPDDSFDEPYAPPNWYLQTFPPTHPSISAINCTYISAIGSVGNWHIGIYTRILLMFLTDPLTRPSTYWMERWIDMTKLLKWFSPTPAFDFFTYVELLWWFVFCVSINPFRWKWALFVFFGLGFALPRDIVQKESKWLNRNVQGGQDKGESF